MSKVTINTLRQNKINKEKIAAITAYNVWDAKLADESGISWILCGDSAYMTCHGNTTTIGITMNEMISHAKSVSKGAKNSFLVGDMPFGSYSITYEAIKNAEKFIEVGMNCIKFEGFRPDILKEFKKNILE